MNTAQQTVAVAPQLQECCLICDGNAHRPDLVQSVDFECDTVLHESLLPEIRTTALLIAASRHDFSQRSPHIFAQEADWFAARILVLNARAFDLDVRLVPMLNAANERARVFAKKHGLAFQAAKISPSLHKNRPNNILLMSVEI